MSAISNKPPTVRRVHIERLELDLRGIAPDTAAAAARALGPALTRALRDRDLATTSASRLDAGRSTSPIAPSSSQLASNIAQQIAQGVSKGRGP